MRSSYKTVILICAFLSAGSFSFAASSREDASGLFSKANSFYEKGEFRQAADCYAGILNMGMESGQVYYNTGNAYFKLGDLGKAILYYEKAMGLIPQDADLKSNLEYARSMTEDLNLAVRKAWWARQLEGLTAALSLDNLTIALFALYVLLACLAAAGVVFHDGIGKKLLVPVTASAIAFAALSASFTVRVYEEEFLRPAIVTVKEADCSFEPFDGSTAYFKVHAGNKVFVVGSRNGWLKVRRLDGKAAWVKKDAVSLI